MKQPIFYGAATALATPFKADETVDFDAFGKLIDWQIAQGINALVPCGTTGETVTMEIDEYKAVVSFCVKRVAGRVPVIAGSGTNGMPHALEHCVTAEAAGADALLIVTPYYNKTSQKGLVAYYTYLAERVNIPVLAYNVPSRTGMTVAPETYREIAKHPRIYGAKDASGDFSDILRIRRECPEDFYIYSGNDDQIVAMMALGGAGVVSVMSNIVPKEVSEMTRRYFAGDVKGALELQIKLSALADALFCEVSPIPLKKAMGLMGLSTDVLRLPLIEIGEKGLDQLTRAMKDLALI